MPSYKMPYPIYCRDCSDKLGKRPDMPSDNALRTARQQRKHHKHTNVPDLPPFRRVSTFDSSSTTYYQECMEEVYAKGAVEETPWSCNLLYVPSRQSSLGTIWGPLMNEPGDTIRVVLADKPEFHGYLVQSDSYLTATCAACGKSLLDP